MYRKLAIAIGINAVVMFLLTYVNLAQASHFYPNINRVYMALVMAFPMVITMLVVMRSMYKNQRLNYALITTAGALTIILILLIRTQTPVGNEQFLRSMIPHHSSAILMCEQSDITDPEIAALCDQIIQSQEAEISQMKTILERY